MFNSNLVIPGGLYQLIYRPVARGGSVGADEPPSEIKGPLF